MERDLLSYEFFLFIKTQDCQLSFPVVGREDDVPLAFKNHVKLHVVSDAVVSVLNLVRKNLVILNQGRQLGDVEALLLHREVLCFRVVPDGQVSLAVLKRVSYGLCRQILLARARDASFRVSVPSFCIVSFLFSALPLSICNDVNAELDLDIISGIIFL